MELIGASAEEDAIAVRFLSFEISNQVNPENITSYAIAFFVGAFIAFILTLSFIREAFSRLKGK